jgi:hypothetical protein
MRRMALEDREEPILQNLASRLGHPIAIDNFLRGSWIIVPDPPDAEYVEGPLLQIIKAQQNGYLAGDCDDAATMAACLVSILHWPSTLIAYRLPGQIDFSHVSLRVPLMNGGVIDIDPIVPEDQLPIRGAFEMQVPVIG